VVGPDGTLYRGNRFADGDAFNPPTRCDQQCRSRPSAAPRPGEYPSAFARNNVPQDARIDHRLDQDFALVASGTFRRRRVIFMDRDVIARQTDLSA
jgi:hypothetical protein